MLTYKGMAGALIACAVVVAPVTSASAHRYHHGFIFGLGAAVVGTAAAIATAPFAAAAAITAPLRAPAYYAPPPAYYAPPGYYGR
jgi:hypothetical protein